MIKILLFVLLAAAAAFAQAPVMIDVTAQLAPWKQYYDAQESWPRAHGFKPFKRYQWLVEQRAYPNNQIPAGAIWEALQERERTPVHSLDEDWVCLGPFNHGGRTRVLRFHPDNPDIMFVGSVGGGLFRSDNAGLSWFPVSDMLANIAIGSFEIDVNNPDIMYLGTGEGYFNGDGLSGIGLLKSTDGGLSWNETGLNYTYSQGKAILKISIDPVNAGVVLASTNDGLYRSTNGGDSFALVRAGNINELKRDPQDPSILLCGAGNPFGGTNGVYRSTNYGANWDPVNDGLPSTGNIGRIVLDFYAGNSQIVYAGVCGTFNYNSTQMIGIFRSVDNGLTWTQMSQDGTNHYSSQGWYDMAIAVKPTNSTNVFSAGLDLYRSTNSAFQWSRRTHWDYNFGHPQYAHADHHEIVFHPVNPDELWDVSDGGVFKSEDNGQTWLEMSTGYATFQYYAMGNATLDTALAYAGAQDNGTTEFAGDPEWDAVFGGDGGYCVVDYADDNTVYVEYQNGNRYRSDNGANNWAEINPGITGGGPWVTPMILDPFDHLTIYTTTNGGPASVWKSTNQGRNGQWENIGPVGGDNQVLEASEAMQGRLYLGSGNTVYRYDEATGNWINVRGNLPNAYVTRVVADPYDPNTVYVTLSGFGTGHVYKSVQAGTVWQNIGGNLPDVPFQDVVVDLSEPSTLYAGCDIGVYYTDNGGQSWQIYGDGLPAVRVDDMDMQTVTGKLRIATHGRGMWEIPTGSSALAMLYPNGGEIMTIGNDIVLRWAGVSVGGDVNIQINRSYPSQDWETVFDSTPNDGLQTWAVTGPASETVRFRILHLTIPEQADTSNGDSRISMPQLTVLYPNGGETVLSGNYDTLRFERILVDEPLIVEVNRDYPNGSWDVLADNESNPSEYRWRVELPGGPNCRIRVRSTTRPEVFDESDANFLLRSPVMDVTSPDGGEQWQAGVSQQITWNAAEHESNLRITLNRDYPNGTWETIAPSSVNDGTHTWTPSAPATTHARIRIAATLDPVSTHEDSDADFAITALDAHEAVLPTAFHISKPYPNPFNPSTSIAIELPARTRVEAVVFNSLGQEAYVLASGVFDAGVHRLTFDGTDLSSGTYFLHVSAFGETAVMKTILLK